MKKLLFALIGMLCLFLSACDLIMPKPIDDTDSNHTHVYSNWKADDTYHWKECECGDIIENSLHSWDDGFITKQPTKDEEGEKAYTCTICGIIKKEKLEKLKQIEIRFDAGFDFEIEAQYLSVGEKVSKPHIPFREGYEFLGWFNDGEEWIFDQNCVKENITLVAKWEIKEYTLTIKLNNGSDDVVISQDYYTTIDAINNPERLGYTFSGWSEEIPTKMPATDKTIEALWTINKYTLTITNYYVDKDLNVVLKYGDEISIEEPSIDGYTFNGYSGELPTTMPANNLVLEAQWEVEIVDYPDLQGYTIKIAQSTHILGEIDPFLPIETKDEYGYYDGPDREARQQAWKLVEELFNCKIEVVPYPSDAYWGPIRWDYIINQARTDSTEYDFYTIPEADVPFFAKENVIFDLTDWYNKYGNNFMDNVAKTSGTYREKLYSINIEESSVYNILGYNVGLWEKINEYNPTIKEPAQMFLDEEWNVSNFIAYCKKCQDVLNTFFGAGYYCLSGWPTYYFVGMVDRNGEGVADVAKKQVHILNEDCTNAANALKDIFDYGAFDEKFSVDEGVVSWTNGKSMFNTGDLWFIGAKQGRWDSNMWGEGDATRYGYVPFPAPDGMEKNDSIYTGTTRETCLIMGKGRNSIYANYGDECTPENIYYAISTYIQKFRKIYHCSEGYDEKTNLSNIASSKFGSQASIDAFMLVNYKINSDGYYEPLVSVANNICSTYGSEFDINLRKFVLGTGAATWAEAISSIQDELNANMMDEYG